VLQKITRAVHDQFWMSSTQEIPADMIQIDPDMIQIDLFA
jgi:hypothetical protein